MGQAVAYDAATQRRMAILEDELLDIQRQLEQVSMSRAKVKKELYYYSGGHVVFTK